MEHLHLIGEKVVLDRFTAPDIGDTYVNWLNDPQVVRFSNQRFHRHDRASCHAYLRSFENTSNLFVSIRRRDDVSMIGTMTAYRHLHHGTADVGIMIGDTSAWGQGYGQEAWNLLINWLLMQEGMRKLTAGTLACNQGMLRLMERAGMQQEAARRAQELVDGRPQDILYYARFKGD